MLHKGLGQTFLQNYVDNPIGLMGATSLDILIDAAKTAKLDDYRIALIV